MGPISRNGTKNFQSYREKEDDFEDSSGSEFEDEYATTANRHQRSDDILKDLSNNRFDNENNCMVAAPITKKDNKKKKKRRRSSARFLSLRERLNEKGDNDEGNERDTRNVTTEETIKNNLELEEMYRKAIRMNTENKINANNSWGLNLIDNIDKFLGDDGDETEGNKVSQSPFSRSPPHTFGSPPLSSSLGSSAGNVKSSARVNFTKASCTIDASVKIYSYRVDDVHLTSYKVLANLNRTDNSKNCDGRNENADSLGSNIPSKVGQRKQSERRGMDNTIETKIANINVSEMDSAYDIDPLFHKMSKSFDEGGAKGLLLANLSIASDSCRIVFDSKEDQVTAGKDEANVGLSTIEEEDPRSNAAEDDSQLPKQDDSNGDEVNDEFRDVAGIAGDGDAVMLGELPDNDEDCVDISILTSKFESLLNGSSFSAVPFMPQMRSVREEYKQLEIDGYVTKDISTENSKSKTYGISSDDEREAEEVIQREALERTRLSQMDTSFAASAISEGNNTFGDDDFGSGGDDFIGDNDNFFENELDKTSNSFLMNDTMEIQPSFYDDNNITFNSEFGFMTSGGAVPENTKAHSMAPYNEKKTTVQLLDFICNGGVGQGVTETGDSGDGNKRYEYFSSSSLEKMASGNAWAGVAHWKKSEKLYKKVKQRKNSKEATTAEKEKEKRSKSTNGRTFVDLFPGNDEEKTAIESLLQTGNARKKGQLQLSKSALSKQLSMDYLLPQDAELGVDQLFCLFLRPNSKIIHTVAPNSKSEKRVGFLERDDNCMNFEDGNNSVCGGGFDSQEFNIFDGKGDICEADDFMVKDLDDIRKVDKVEVGYATVAKKVDVKRLKDDLWAELETRTSSAIAKIESKKKLESEDDDNLKDEDSEDQTFGEDTVSFNDVVNCIDESQQQEGVSIAFYFICVLHLANEKCLKLDPANFDLKDFLINRDTHDDVMSLLRPSVENDDSFPSPSLAKKRVKRTCKVKTLSECIEHETDESSDDASMEDFVDE